jgi:hypothetical protein
MTPKFADWHGSVLVRVYPLPDAAPAALKTLAAGVSQWFTTGARRAGFGVVWFDRGQLAALQAGELPLPEVLFLRNAIRRRKRIDNPATKDFVERLRQLTLADWRRILPESTRRALCFRVFGVGPLLKDLFQNLCTYLHAPAVARLEFAWETVEAFDRIGERTLVWEVDSDA